MPNLRQKHDSGNKTCGILKDDTIFPWVTDKVSSDKNDSSLRRKGVIHIVGRWSLISNSALESGSYPPPFVCHSSVFNTIRHQKDSDKILAKISKSRPITDSYRITQ